MRVYTGGTFDLFHTGHVNLLRACAEVSSEDGSPPDVWVSLNTDAFIEAYKGRPPVVGYEDRRAVLEACRYVDKVVPNVGGADSKTAIVAVRPRVIVIGDDWKDRDYHAQMGFTQDWLDERGIWLRYVPYTPGISSTQIRDRLWQETFQ